ncbi:MAG TPA: hypothetical protein VMJ93_04340 [Verrucomicrobiae bacterium]|nr:hypothetical protein [Verrucomicrobiae bacterium]
MVDRKKPLEDALEEAISRAVRDNLAPLQRTADELHQAYADLVAACGSTRPSNALPAMLRAQTSAAALAAGLSVLSNFIAVALNPREKPELHGMSARGVAEAEQDWEESAKAVQEEAPAAADSRAIEETIVAIPESPAEVSAEAVAQAETPTFDIARLPGPQQDLHRRANRVAKVAMQDIKLLRPQDVRLGREQKDLCQRLRNDLDKARKEYDRRFRAILDHPVDYFHHWMVEILAEGDTEALGEYPYPSPVLRR